MSLQTPVRVRRLPRALYVKAKTEAACRSSLRPWHKVLTRGTRRCSAEQVCGLLGGSRTRPLPVGPQSCASA